VNSVAEYSNFINNPDNGLIVTRKINGLKISVKYLPAEYLEYKEMQGDKEVIKNQLDSLKKEYENSITFLMSIGPDEDKGNKNDIMFDKIANYKEYAERLLSLNFEIDKNITLKTGNLELKPVLSALENTYGLSKSRNIVFAFAVTKADKEEIEKSNELDFSYSDDLFQLGLMHFNFSKNKLENLPLISQWKK
jgi:hypothetical protein